ncbi:hypothetical protein QBA36_43595, partial [Streptomyces stelliscabiei]
MHRRAFAVEALNHALRDGDPLILTSRTAAYRDVLRDMRGISAAAVVEALPVRGQDAVAYLESGTSPLHLDRWRPVFEELRESPPEPVALALSNPLMLWLARRGYAQPHTDPAELTDTTRLPTPPRSRNTCWSTSCPPSSARCRTLRTGCTPPAPGTPSVPDATWRSWRPSSPTAIGPSSRGGSCTATPGACP